MRKGVPIPTVLRKLKKEYPHADCTLDWTTPLELLVATILAAQCTDARVNIVTQSLFQKYKTPSDYLAVPQEELEKDVRSCGSFRMKAKAIQTTCRTLLENFHGEVPRTMKEMLTLRGVGRKTAAVVLGTAFHVIEGIPIDTHNIRLSHRLGLTKQQTQARIELDLMRRTPHEDWLHLSHLLVAHGRRICQARVPLCTQCVFKNECPSSTVRQKRKSA